MMKVKELGWWILLGIFWFVFVKIFGFVSTEVEIIIAVILIWQIGYLIAKDVCKYEDDSQEKTEKIFSMSKFYAFFGWIFIPALAKSGELTQILAGLISLYLLLSFLYEKSKAKKK